MRKFSRGFFALLHRRGLKWQLDDDMSADAVRRRGAGHFLRPRCTVRCASTRPRRCAMNEV